MNQAIKTLYEASVYIPQKRVDEEKVTEAEYATALAQVNADLRELEWAREQLRIAAEDTTIFDLRNQIDQLEQEFEQELERKDLALRHYAAEENWREATLQGPPMIFEYDGGWEQPWHVAREGLAKPEPEPERCRALHPHPTTSDYFIRCGLEEGHEGNHQLVSETGGTVSWEDEETYLN